MPRTFPETGAVSRYLRGRPRSPDFQRVWFFRQHFFLEEECLGAFRRLGLTVREWEAPAELDGPGLAWLLSGLVEFRPDFIFSINHIGFDKEGWLTGFLAAAELPAATWYVDNPEPIIRAWPANVSPWVQVFAWDRQQVNSLKSMGFPHADYLPLAADERLFRPCRGLPASRFGAPPAAFVGSSWTQRVNQMLAHFAGQQDKLAAIETAARAFQTSPGYTPREDLARVYPGLERLPLLEQVELEAAVLWRACQRDRREKIVPLSRLGLTVFGDPAWRQVLPEPGNYGGRIDYRRELPVLYQVTGVNLNVTSLQMKQGLNQRVFDVPAAGAFLLTDEKEVLWEIFSEAEVATYGNLAEAADKLAFYRKHPQIRARLAAQARHRVLAGHTYVHRMRQVLAVMQARFPAAHLPGKSFPRPASQAETGPVRSLG